MLQGPLVDAAVKAVKAAADEGPSAKAVKAVSPAPASQLQARCSHRIGPAVLHQAASARSLDLGQISLIATIATTATATAGP